MSEEVDNGPPVSKKYLQKVLRESMKDAQKVELVSYKTKPGSGQGDNVTSNLIAIDAQILVDGKQEQHHLLLKKMPQNNPFMRDFSNAAQLYTKEVAAYVDVFPYMVSFQKKQGASRVFFPPVPRYYHSYVDGERDTLVIQDVRPLGYQMRDRFQGLPFQESCLALRELAKLHAVSYAIKLIEGRSLVEVFPTGRETICTENNRIHGKIYAFTVQNATKMVEKDAGPDGPQLADRMRKLHERAWEIVLKGFNDYEHPFSVLNHGDVWINNLLFKYEEDPEHPGQKRPIDVFFIDFQMTRVIPFTLELTYFFYTSTTYDLRKAHLQDMKKVYWDSFLQTLQDLKVEPASDLTYEAFEKNMQEMLQFGLIFMCFAIPMQLANPKQPTEGSDVHKRRGSGMFDKEDDDESLVDSYLRAFAVDLYKRMSNIGKERLIDVVREIAEMGGI